MSKVEGQIQPQRMTSADDPWIGGDDGGVCVAGDGRDVMSPAAHTGDAVAPEDTVEYSEDAPISTSDRGRTPRAANEGVALGAAVGAGVHDVTGVLAEEAAKSMGATPTHGWRATHSVAGRALGMLGHVEGDARVSESSAGHAAASATNTGSDELISRGVKAAIERLPAQAARVVKMVEGAGAVGGIVDGFVDIDNPAKIATSFAKDANATAVLSGAAAAAVDGATVVGDVITGDRAAAYRAAERMQTRAINGDYSPIAQTMTAGVAAVTGDIDTMERFVDGAAKRGERGTWLAVGNCVADGGDPIADRSGWEHSSWSDDHAHMRARVLYKPWTW